MLGEGQSQRRAVAMVGSTKEILCPICGHNTATRLFESRDRIHALPGVFAIFRCQHCLATFIQPWLTYGELAVYYPRNYGGYRHSRSLDRKNYRGLRRFVLESYYGYPSPDDKRHSLLSRSIGFLLSFVIAKDAIPYQGEGKFLDVGCGGGSYLYRLKQWGWDVYGVEPSESGVQQARALGLDVRHGELVDAHFPSNFFDVVRLNHVLEHLPEPKETFHEARRILKSDGIVLVTVPNSRSLNFWLFGENWYGLDAPRHVITYCPQAIEVLCNSTGFEVAKIQFHSGAFNFVRSVKYFLEENGRHSPQWLHRIDWPRNKLIRRSLKPFFFLVDIVRFGDVMTAILRKSRRDGDQYAKG